MKRIRTGVAIVAMLGVVAGAWAARMGFDFDRLPHARASMMLASAQAAATAGTRSQGSQPLIPPVDLMLSGEVVDVNATSEPLSVVAYLGDQSLPASVQGNRYWVKLPGGNAQGMVRVEARAGHNYYVSVLGAYQRMVNWAGADRTLDLDEQPALRVSPYSTALYWLTRYALGDRLARSDAEFERAMRATNGGEIEAASALLWIASNNPQELAGRYPDGLSKLRDRSYFQSYMQGVHNPGHWAEAFLSWQKTYAPLRSLDELPAQTVMMSALKMDGLPQSVDRLHYLERTSPTTFTMVENTAQVGRRYTASLDEKGDVQLEPIYETRGMITDPDTGTTYIRTYLHYSLRRLYRGERYSQWYLQLTWEDDGPNSTPASFPVRSGHSEYVLSGINVEQWELPQDFAALESGTRALPWFCMGAHALSLSQCEYTEHRRRADGSGELIDYGAKVDSQGQALPNRRIGPAFTWSIDTSGGLVVTTADVATSFWRVDSNEQGVGPVLYRARSLRPGSEGLAMMGLAFTVPQRDANEALTAASGRWVGGASAAMPSLYSEDMGYEEYLRYADGSMQRRSVYEGTQWPWRTATWQNLGGTLLDSVHYVTSPATTCSEAIASGAKTVCISRLYYFRPLRRMGNRYYGIQEIYEQWHYVSGPMAPQLWASQGVAWDCTEGACLGSSGLAANAAPPRAMSIARPVLTSVRGRVVRASTLARNRQH